MPKIGVPLQDDSARLIVEALMGGGVELQLDDTDKQAVSAYGVESEGSNVGLGGFVTNADAKSKLGTSIGAMGHMSFNESTWDRIRGNTTLLVMASAARTASANSSTITNYNARGVLVTMYVTAVVDTPSCVLHIQGILAGTYKDLFIATAAITATGVYTYLLYPANVTIANDVTEAEDLPLPRSFRIRVIHADGDSITYSVECNLIL